MDYYYWLMNKYLGLFEQFKWSTWNLLSLLNNKSSLNKIIISVFDIEENFLDILTMSIFIGEKDNLIMMKLSWTAKLKHFVSASVLGNKLFFFWKYDQKKLKLELKISYIISRYYLKEK